MPARVRHGMIQLARRFLLHQPDCALVQWYRERTGAGRKLIVVPACSHRDRHLLTISI